MRLDAGAVIPPDKVRDYLLAWRQRNDKSRYFARAGYTQEAWPLLAGDLRTQILPLDATLSRQSEYGDLYTIDGALTGPNGVVIEITTVWIVEAVTGITRLVTAYPHDASEAD